MEGYVKELLEFTGDIEGTARTPASSGLFKIDKDSKELTEARKERFHTITAKLLYLGKRVRPDMLTAISFLTRRVQKPTEQDESKLHRAIRYLRGSQHLGIILQPTKHLCVCAYIDAAYGVHADMKSQSGCVIGIGKGPIFARSSIQRLNTKSSTEAELVALSDNAGQLIWTREFLIQQGYSIGTSSIFEDNMSTIKLLEAGKGNSERSRHIAIRYFFLHDRIQSGEIKVQYLATEDMLADILTKPMQGSQFERLRAMLLNWPNAERTNN
jgi:hypothetical protein